MLCLNNNNNNSNRALLGDHTRQTNVIDRINRKHIWVQFGSGDSGYKRECGVIEWLRRGKIVGYIVRVSYTISCNKFNTRMSGIECGGTSDNTLGVI